MDAIKKEKTENPNLAFITDLETKLHRVESKLQNMSKFSHIFIKSIKQ